MPATPDDRAPERDDDTTRPDDVAPPDHLRRLAIAFSVTGAVVVAQAVGAFVTGSLALLVDTAHMLTDTAGLGVALLVAHLARRPPTSRRTWGFRRAEVLAALLRCAVLLVVGVYVVVEGVQRLRTPPEMPTTELLVFGVIGLSANLVSMAVLWRGRGANFNLRVAFLEVLTDALGSVGVITAAIVISTTGYQQADAIAGLLIGVLIVPRALLLVRETGAVLLESTPEGLDLDEVRAHLLDVPGVLDVHDLHAALVTTGLPVVTAHVVVDDACFEDARSVRVLRELHACLATHFELPVGHTTFQIEPAEHATLERLGHP